MVCQEWNVAHMKYIYSIVCFLMISSYANANDAALIKKCRYYNNKIEHYTNLKRSGGSASQMNHWQKLRNEYKDKYSDNNCKSVRNKL
jgi:hypothetical protein